MTTTKAKPETIARRTGKGAYDNTYESRLVRLGEAHYLVIDQWCGRGIEGECYRPHVYQVPAELVDEVREAHDKPNESFEGYSNWQIFMELTLQTLPLLGRQSRLTGELKKM